MDINFIKSNLEKIIKYKDIKNFNNFFNKNEIDEVIKQANLLLNQTFIFNKPWDMERCKTPYHLETIDWNVIKNDDEEWCFMLNRMDYLSHLALAYLKTDNIEYKDKILFYIKNWIENHKSIKKELSTRTLDTAIRIMNWVQALTILEYKNALTYDDINIIFNSIFNQIKFLKENYLTKYKTSNWGSIQTTVIISVIPIFIENYKNNNIYSWAYEEMKDQINAQIYPDGMFWEQSTMYHIEVLNYGMKAIFYYKLFNNNKKELWFNKIEALADSLFYQLTPTCEIETFGDSDRIVAKDVFNRACVLFKNNYYKYVGNKCYDIESLYMFGVKFAKKYNLIEPKKPKNRVYNGIYSGMFTIKSDWNKNASFTMFTNGSLGSGHGHSDNLHLSIFYKGEFMLIDTGRFTYRENHPLRQELKNSFSHNKTILNNKEFCVPKGSWGYDNFGIVLKTYFNHIDKYHYLEGGMIGDNPLQILIRKIVIIDPSIWLIVDDIKADNENFATCYYHIDPYKNIAKKENDILIYGKNGTLKILQDISPKIETKKCSLLYNELLNHKVISYEKVFKDDLQLITCICDEKIKVKNVDLYQGDKKTPLNIGFGKKFIISQNESYTIVIYHKEIFKGQKVLSCDGMYFHAKCVIIHEKNGTKTLKVLKA